jgi:hypothetical protein
MNIAVLSAVSVVMHLSAYIRENDDVDHRTAVLPFRVARDAFMDIHDNGCTRETLEAIARVLGDRRRTRLSVRLIVRYVQGLIAMGDMAGYDLARAVRDWRAVHVAAAA